MLLPRTLVASGWLDYDAPPPLPPTPPQPQPQPPWQQPPTASAADLPASPTPTAAVAAAAATGSPALPPPEAVHALRLALAAADERDVTVRAVGARLVVGALRLRALPLEAPPSPPLAPAEPAIDARAGVYLVTGGTGGIGAQLVAWLVTEWGVAPERVLLLCRKEPAAPPPHGARVLLVGDALSSAAALCAVPELRALRGSRHDVRHI